MTKAPPVAQEGMKTLMENGKPQAAVVVAEVMAVSPEVETRRKWPLHNLTAIIHHLSLD